MEHLPDSVCPHLGHVLLSPIFGRRNIPNYYKVGFCFILTIITAQSITVPDISSYSSLVSYMALIGKELLLGVTIGFISYALFSAIYIAGQLIDTQIGFGMVNVIDPLTNLQIPITADFYVILATLFMLVTDTHHLLIKAIVDSYSIIPPEALVSEEERCASWWICFTIPWSSGLK